jgi:CubicO group peptidase (beta-lactamase class C family)
MILLDRGAIKNIDESVSSFIAGAKAKPALKKLTLRHLLTHTCGFVYPNLWIAEGPRQEQIPLLARGAQMSAEKMITELTRRAEAREVRNLEEYVDELIRTPLASDPGTEWQYGYGLDIVGRVIEVVSGQSLSCFLEENIFGPLQMKDTGFVVPASELHRIGPLYRAGAKDRTTAEPRFHIIDSAGVAGDSEAPPCGYTDITHSRIHSGGGGIERTNGGLVSTTADWQRFSQCLLHNGSLEGIRILRHDTLNFSSAVDHLQIATANSTGSGTPPRTIGLPGLSFCLLGSLVTDPAAHMSPCGVGTYGWGGYGGTAFKIDPANGIGFIFMTQRATDAAIRGVWQDVEAGVYAGLAALAEESAAPATPPASPAAGDAERAKL